LSDSQSSRFLVQRYTRDGMRRVPDTVTREEPLEIRIQYSFKDSRRTESIAVTMRTPGNERELAVGFLYAEGVLSGRRDLLDVRMLGSGESNEVLVEIQPERDVESWRLRRATLVSSACGICGKASMESIPEVPSADGDDLRISAALVYDLPRLLKERQTAFGQSGGLHAAALVTPEGEVAAVFEDVGRHNALDKLIGAQLLGGGLPLRGKMLLMSSRGSFELVQKALAAGATALITIGAPSTLAIEFARSRGLTLIGFVRDDHFNVYAGEWRVHYD
jgi:FdhD protein